jgi:hypothetical protein
MAMGAAFSALHVAAWNWEFPSLAETMLWRVASLTATTACFLVAILLTMLGNGSKSWQALVVRGCAMPLWAAYMLCRAVLLIQVFLCFRAMPERIYQTVQWTVILPHFS